MTRMEHDKRINLLQALQLPRIAAVLLLAALCLGASLWFFTRPQPPSAEASLVNIAFIGHSTNELGQRSVVYRVQNRNGRNLLGLAEFTNATPGSGLFVKLPSSEPQTIVLTAPPGGNPSGVQITCFAEDLGLLSRMYALVQRFRGKRPHEITKLFFTVRGPPAEP